MDAQLDASWCGRVVVGTPRPMPDTPLSETITDLGLGCLSVLEKTRLSIVYVVWMPPMVSRKGTARTIQPALVALSVNL